MGISLLFPPGLEKLSANLVGMEGTFHTDFSPGYFLDLREILGESGQEPLEG